MGKAYRKVSEWLYNPNKDPGDRWRYRRAQQERVMNEPVRCTHCNRLVKRNQAGFKQKLRGQPRRYWCQSCTSKGFAPIHPDET